jgi:hypothetical protein
MSEAQTDCGCCGQSAGNIDSQFPRWSYDGVSFVDCIFRGVRASEVVAASGSILLPNVKIEPTEKVGV